MFQVPNHIRVITWRNKTNQTKNGENGIIFTHGGQHGVRHRGSHDVASEGHVLTVQRPSPEIFEPVAFTKGGVALATSYKNAKMPNCWHGLPLLPTFFTWTQLLWLHFIWSWNTINTCLDSFWRHPRLVQHKPYNSPFESSNSSHQRIIALVLELSLEHLLCSS